MHSSNLPISTVQCDIAHVEMVLKKVSLKVGMSAFMMYLGMISSLNVTGPDTKGLSAFIYAVGQGPEVYFLIKR